MTNSDRRRKIDADTAHVESVLEPVMLDIPEDLGIEEEPLALRPEDLGIEVQEIAPEPKEYAMEHSTEAEHSPAQPQAPDYAQGLDELNDALLNFQRAMVPMAASSDALRRAAQAAYGAVVIALGEF